MNYRLLIQYDGTRYCTAGSGRTRPMPPSRARFEVVLSRLEGRPVEIDGAGRTDAGVHALGQVANVHLTERPAEEIRNYLKPVSAGRHRNYRSKAGFRAIPQPGERLGESIRIPPGHRSGRFTYSKRKYMTPCEEPLDLDAMKEAAAYLVGEHDFQKLLYKENEEIFRAEAGRNPSGTASRRNKNHIPGETASFIIWFVS